MRLIDADAIHIPKMETGLDDTKMRIAIANTPTVDAVKVKHGHWEIAIGYDPKKAFQCSECRLMSYDPTEFCSHCGAKMDEVAE